MDFAALTNTLLEFIGQHPNWAAVLVFGESLPFASLVLPFWAVLVGVGTIIAVADPLIFWTIVVAAAIGAAVGDWLSYWIGYH
jgi:membrane protein DedA with SNARE-associated domain